MAATTYQEWLNRNSYRAFPLVEDSNRACGGSELPNKVVLDARFCLFRDSGTLDQVTLISAEILESGDVRLEVGIDESTVTVTSSDSVAAYSDDMVSFRILVGHSDDLAELTGSYVLDNPAKFLASRVLSVPYGIGVDTLQCEGDQPVATGVVEADDGHNTTLDVSGNNLVLGIRQAAGRGVLCPESGQTDVCGGSVLYFINGQRANSDGSFSIIAGEGVTVGTGTYRNLFGESIPAVIVKTNSAVDAFMGKR